MNKIRQNFFPQNKSVTKQKIKSLASKRNNEKRKKDIERNSHDDAKVNISDAIRDFSRLKKIVDMSPEINNSDKIAKLKEQIKNGSYKFHDDALSERIMEQEFPEFSSAE